MAAYADAGRRTALRARRACGLPERGWSEQALKRVSPAFFQGVLVFVRRAAD